ncbi:GNAT family N-acetyltransferase [Nonlabens dokdonensis]|uniref:GNAT family N-acetyltransferase n=1 Tax=Nonlabens dokdonensis TaxID=328515 RepID=A0A1Z8AGV1_9FLAO|nr:GNAT family N-acetyltransferase [Nonlabens dokdonensis]OUS09576.1 GNAT family N-acetyltransferase [Nonlabens dokdonensis]
MKLELETDRLYLRPFIKEDAPYLFELNNDEEVMRYTGDVPFKDLEAAQEFAIDYNTNKNSQYQLYHMGRIAVIRKSDDAFLGWSGLKYHKSADFVDIGYRFMRKYWGHGYATESGIEVVRHGFEDHQLDILVAQVHELNYSSQKVARRLGMSLEHRFYWEEREPGRHYQINKNHYFNTVKK